MTQVIKVSLGKRERPLRGCDTPVVPGFAPAVMALYGAIHHGRADQPPASGLSWPRLPHSAMAAKGSGWV
jgi:hypothetical protein